MQSYIFLILQFYLLELNHQMCLLLDHVIYFFNILENITQQYWFYSIADGRDQFSPHDFKVFSNISASLWINTVL